MLRKCYTDRGSDMCADFQDYTDPATGALAEFPNKFATVTGLATDYSYDLLVGSRNLNFHGYASFSDPLRVRPGTALWGSAARLHVTGVERDKIYLSWEPAEGESARPLLPPPLSLQPLIMSAHHDKASPSSASGCGRL